MPDIDDAIIRDLYEAAAGLRSWQEPLATLHVHFRLAGIQLVTVDKTTGRLVFSEQPVARFDQRTLDATFEHVREWHRCDPHMAHVARLPVGEMMHSADVFGPEQRETLPFYRDYWSAYGVRSILAAKVAEDDRHVAMIGMSRTFAEPAFAPDEIAIARRYVGHLASAFRVAQHFRLLRASASAGTVMLHASARPMILLSLERTILTCNASGQQILAAGDVLRRDGALLAASTASAHRMLEQALREVGAREAPGSNPQRIGLRLAGLAGRTLLCSVWALQPDATMGAFGPQPAAMLTVVPLGHAGAVDPVFLGALFDLTPAEARLAIALMAGKDLSEIASERRLSVQTVRSQLRSLFGKTGTRRQAELVAVLIRATAA